MEVKEFKGGFEQLDLWKEGRKFRNKISELTQKFPRDEKYILRSQILRSARSVTSNIAEGYGRFHFKENIQFCRTARGSLMETLEHLYVALDENYIQPESFNNLKKDYDRLLRLLNGYISYLNDRLKNEKI
jgi:four helix bundle protein